VHTSNVQCVVIAFDVLRQKRSRFALVAGLDGWGNGAMTTRQTNVQAPVLCSDASESFVYCKRMAYPRAVSVLIQNIVRRRQDMIYKCGDCHHVPTRHLSSCHNIILPLVFSKTLLNLTKFEFPFEVHCDLAHDDTTLKWFNDKSTHKPHFFRTHDFIPLSDLF